MISKSETIFFSLSFLSLLVILLVAEIPQNYLQYRAGRYEFCENHKAEIIAKYRPRKQSTGGGRLGNFKASNKPAAIVENGVNVNHPCDWLKSHYKLRDKSTSLTGR